MLEIVKCEKNNVPIVILVRMISYDVIERLYKWIEREMFPWKLKRATYTANYYFTLYVWFKWYNDVK